MKKILFLLLITVASYGQTYPTNPTKFGKISLNTNGVTTSTSRINSQNPVTNEIDYIDAVNLPVPTTVTNALDLKKNATSTAITSTLTITNNGATFSVSAFTGKIVNNSTVPATITNINFAGANNVTPMYFRTILYVNTAGSLIQFNGATSDLTPLQRVDNIFIGLVVYSGGVVQVVQTTPDIEYATDNRLAILGNYIRNINDGNNLGANGANLQINKGAGSTWRLGSNFATDRKVPDVTTDIAATPIPAGVNLIGYRNGSGGWTYEAYTGSITPQFWDNGTGTKATVANNKFTNQRVYFFNGTNTYVIYLGRTEHSTLSAAATDAERPVSIVDPATSVGSLIGTVSVAYNATALNNPAQATFTQGPRMQGGASSGGTSGTQNLQSTYLNSLTPQITTTPALGAVSIRNGSASDANNIFTGQNIAGTNTFSVTGAGNITGGTYNGYTPENVANKTTNFTTVNNTLYPTVEATKNYIDLAISNSIPNTIYHETVATSTGTVSSVGTNWTGTSTSLTSNMEGGYVEVSGVGIAIIASVNVGAQTFTTLQALNTNVTNSPFEIHYKAYRAGSDGIIKQFRSSDGEQVMYIESNGNARYNGLRIDSNGNVVSEGFVFQHGDVQLRNNGEIISRLSTLTPYTVATLPTPDSNKPAFAIVNDALNPVTNTAVVGGGTETVPVFFNGTSWLVNIADISGKINGTGTTNYLPVFSGSNTLGNSFLSQNAESISFGTLRPQFSIGFSVSKYSTVMNRHVYEDYSLLNPTVGGSGFGTFDASTELMGTVDNAHFMAYQSRLKYTSSGNLTDSFGLTSFISLNTHEGSGDIAVANGFLIHDVGGVKGSNGDIGVNSGITIENMQRGLENWAINSKGGDSRFNGDIYNLNGKGFFAYSQGDKFAVNSRFSSMVNDGKTSFYTGGKGTFSPGNFVFRSFDGTTVIDLAEIQTNGNLGLGKPAIYKIDALGLDNNGFRYTGSSVEVVMGVSPSIAQFGSTSDHPVQIVVNSNGVASFDADGNFVATGGITATTFTGDATLTGTPTAPTAPVGTNTDQIATMDAINNALNTTVNYIPKKTGTGTLGDSRISESAGLVVIDGDLGVSPLSSGVITGKLFRTATYLVSNLPASPGTNAYATVTDASAPTYLTPVVGGGSVVCPVFYNGTTWVAH